MEVPARPAGGAERPSHVGEALAGEQGAGAILHTDRACAFPAYLVGTLVSGSNAAE